MDVDGTLLKKTIVVETLKRNPRLALRFLVRRPQLYAYGLAYALFPADALRSRLHDEMKRLPKGEFGVEHFRPEFVRVLRLAEEKGYPVHFVTSNPENTLDRFETLIRTAFPRLNYQIRVFPTLQSKIDYAHQLAKRYGYENVHFFDDSLPARGYFSSMKAQWDLVQLLHEWERHISSKSDRGLDMLHRREGI
ncbi:MAG: hypothetical protein GXN93_04655 [Candidatus Diapherotrites archaeon]|nr:hypothetical protein [Candidatus Diapherotrites archaeon]